MPQAPSTRWCPTPEQLMILEEMYRSGVRTPNASQIQHITAHLSYYGKIEGKNVFYWFQNHKARDRQKMRRRLSRHQQLLQQQQQQHNGAAQPHPQIFQMEPPNPSLHPPPQFSFQHPPQFLHQGSYQENSSVVNPGMNLVCKLEAWGKEGEVERSSSAMATSSSTSGNFVDWTSMVDMGTAASLPPCCRPLKTLELFPTNSTGLRDEFCSTSKSSSCSTSTTN